MDKEEISKRPTFSDSLKKLESFDDSKSIKRNGNSIQLYLTILFSCIGGFLFGYDTGVISGAMLLMKHQFDLTTFEQSLIVSVTIVGAWVFSLASGYFSDRFGRKIVILISSFVFTIGSLVMAFGHSAIYLIVGRFILGVAIGFSSSTIPVYIAEVTQYYQRGNLVLLYNCMLTGGQFVSGLVAGIYSTHAEGWRYMVGLAAIPSAFQFLYFFFAFESPRYLLKIGKDADAFKSLKSLRTDDDLTSLEFEEIKRNLENNNFEADRKETGGVICVLKKSRTNTSLRKALILGCALQLVQQLSGINTVMYYSATIIEMAGVSDKSKAIWLSSITGFVNWIFTFVGLIFVERLGRRKLVLFSGAGVCFTLLFLSASFHIAKSNSPAVTMNDTNSTCSLMSNCHSCILNTDCGFCYLKNKGTYQSTCLLKSDDLDYSKNGFCSKNASLINKSTFITSNCPSDYAYLIIIGLVLYLVVFASGLGCMPWVINSEIFPLSYRSACFSLSTSMNWVSNTLVSLTFLSLIESLTETGTFIIYAGFSLVGLVYFYFNLPETRGLKLEEIEKLFDTKSQKTQVYSSCI